MKRYHLLILTLEGRAKAQYDLICADDDAAKKDSTRSMQSKFGTARASSYAFLANSGQPS